MMFARGAVACAHSTSSATSSAHRLCASCPVPLFGGGGVGEGQPWKQTMSNRGDCDAEQFADGSLGPVSPHMCGSPNALLNTPRSCLIVEAPNESTIAIVLPCP